MTKQKYLKPLIFFTLVNLLVPVTSLLIFCTFIKNTPEIDPSGHLVFCLALPFFVKLHLDDVLKVLLEVGLKLDKYNKKNSLKKLG